VVSERDLRFVAFVVIVDEFLMHSIQKLVQSFSIVDLCDLLFHLEIRQISSKNNCFLFFEEKLPSMLLLAVGADLY
jgi:hypothetical protein